MKKKAILLAMASLALMTVGCSKQKTCRCSVIGRSTVRIINVDGGDCSDITKYTYHNEYEQTIEEDLVCTDYEFAIDSIYNKD